MRVLIAGLGSIGRRHLKNLRSLEPDAHITVWRQHSKPREKPDDIGSADSIVYCLEDALEKKPELALITNPSSLHIETGLALAQHGINLFIEKPLSNSLDNIEKLLDLCRQRNMVLMVGYPLRFSRAFQVVRQILIDGRIGRLMTVRAEVGQFLPDWRPSSDYLKSVSARYDLGGGAVLELSHELDYLNWLVGEIKTVSAQIAHLSDLNIDVEDTAEIILQFKNGVIGSVHLDMTQRVSTRTCRFVGTEGTLVWDGISDRVQMFSAESNSWSDLYTPDAVDRNEMYLSELRHFINCVKKEDKPLVSGEEGLYVLKIALAVKESSQYQRVIEL